MNRKTLIRLADAIEDAMCETGRGSTAEDRALWWAAKPLWILIQKLLREVQK
jgi:hypothetical protein